MQPIVEAIKQACKDLFNIDVEPALVRPDEQFGDYATNVALQLAGRLNKNPREIAIALASKLHGQPDIAQVSIAGAGFINIKLTDEVLLKSLSQKPDAVYENQEILVEFGDPNPFKQMHIGHLYSYIVGDSICRLFEADGAKVQRLSYHGDVGLHVAKAIWGMQHLRGDPADISAYYITGTKAYEQDEESKRQIHDINEHIYRQDDEKINELYQRGKEKSFSYFDEILKNLGVKTDRRYLESESAATGEQFVRQNTGKVFEQSDGAVVYKGEKVGMHTRVFITSKGLPTYEAKDLGLAELKNKDYPAAKRSIIITASEQAEYFKVMLAALAEIDPRLTKKTTHLTHGFLSLSTGKMSSRTGEVFGAVELMTDVKNELKKRYPDSPAGTDLAAIKYGFLKHRLGSDIVYDVNGSISLEGNSGPYLQYARARARSILAKAGESQNIIDQKINLDAGERSLARKISEYAEVVERATTELMPHHVCTYLYELAQTFNRFYENSRVIGDERQQIRTRLVENYANVLKDGLNLLGISAPDKM